MKRLYLVLPLACLTLLISGCPDAKLPTPTPMVPAPKAQGVAGHGLQDQKIAAASGRKSTNWFSAVL